MKIRDENMPSGKFGIPADIINIVKRDFDHWELAHQFIRTCEPFVDSVGYLESREANLAGCSVELVLRYASYAQA